MLSIVCPDRRPRKCKAAFLKARPSVRRRFNEPVLEAVRGKDRRIRSGGFSNLFAPSSLARVPLELDLRRIRPLTSWLPARKTPPSLREVLPEGLRAADHGQGLLIVPDCRFYRGCKRNVNLASSCQ
jgi:hypothetical protein